MKQHYSWLLVGALSTGLCGFAAAQDTGAPAPGAPASSPAPAPAATKAAHKSTAQIDAGEPRANTSGSPTAAEPASSGSSPAPAAASAAGATPAAASGASKAPAKTAAAPKAPGAADRLNLGTATVTGDREQPKVMYIVPWKKSDIGDLSGKPMNSLLDEALAPVDRDEFKREVAYFDAVKADTSQNNAGNGAAKQGEK